MSGKKRSQVEAALRDASRAADAARGLLAEADSRSIRSLGKACQAGLRQAEEAGSGRARIPSGLSGDEVSAARSSASAADAALDHARRLQEVAADSLKKAAALDRAAANAFGSAQTQLDEAQEALARSTGEHYKDREWELANRAGAAFEAAKREASAAQSARKRAIADGQAAVEAAAAATASAKRATRAIRGGVAAAEERQRREAEARRIAEEARRRAMTAVAAAAAAVQALPAEDGRKFTAPEYQAVERDLGEAEAALRRGDLAGAQQRAERLQIAAQALARRVAQAREEFDRRQSAAAGAIAALASAMEGANQAVIEEWSAAPSSYGEAKAALEAARRAAANEDFDSASALAQQATEAVRRAMESGADAKAADGRRSSIGQAVMEVLTEMNFDVSFQAGTRDEPLRISGQTADETGRGDFDLAIPLDGEVDFEVTAEAGDSACVEAVNELRTKLRERGVPWETTDWGHAAESASKSGQGQIRTNVKAHNVTRTRTR